MLGKGSRLVLRKAPSTVAATEAQAHMPHLRAPAPYPPSPSTPTTCSRPRRTAPRRARSCSWRSRRVPAPCSATRSSAPSRTASGSRTARRGSWTCRATSSSRGTTGGVGLGRSGGRLLQWGGDWGMADSVSPGRNLSHRIISTSSNHVLPLWSHRHPAATLPPSPGPSSACTSLRWPPSATSGSSCSAAACAGRRWRAR